MESNKKLSPIATELFLRGRNLNISLVFISQSYFKVPKTIRLNATHYVIMKIPNQKRTSTNSIKSLSNVGFKDSMKNIKNILKNHIHF